MIIHSWDFLYKESSVMVTAPSIRPKNAGVNSRRFPGRVLKSPVVTRQSDQSQVALLKPLHCPVRVYTRTDLFLQRSRWRWNPRSPNSCSYPESLVQKWVTGPGGSCFVTIVSKLEEPRESFPLGPGEGVRSFFWGPHVGFRGGALRAVGCDSSKQALFCLLH